MSGSGKPTDISKQQRALRADTADRLEAIVEAAERAAEGVIDDAEKQAHRYLAQARAEAGRQTEGQIEEVSELIDTLLGQAVSLRREAERLQATLEAARAQLGGEESPEAPRLRAVDSAEAPAAEPESRRADASGARLLATQMAVSGSSREEIAQRLRNGFEIEDTDAILDAILGPEG
jgi:cell division septum initiation protein DivIVA